MKGMESDLRYTSSRSIREGKKRYDGAKSTLAHETSGHHRASQVTPPESPDYSQIFRSTMAERFTSDQRAIEDYMDPQVRENYMRSIIRLGTSMANRQEIATHDLEANHEAFQESNRIQEEIEHVYGSRARDNAVFFAYGVAERIMRERQNEMEPQADCRDIFIQCFKGT